MFTLFRRLITIIAFFISAQASVFSQSDFTVSGGDASGTDGFMSYSVGQVSFETYFGNEGSISLGVQQSHVITFTLGNTIEENDIQIDLFPNPALREYQIKWSEQVPQGVEAEVYDLFGRKLNEFKIKSDDERYTIEAWPPGIYIIKIYQNQSLIKTMKLIKS